MPAVGAAPLRSERCRLTVSWPEGWGNGRAWLDRHPTWAAAERAAGPHEVRRGERGESLRLAATEFVAGAGLVGAGVLVLTNIVYDDNVPAILMQTLESLAVVTADSQQHQVAGDIILALESVLDGPAGPYREAAIDVLMRTLPALSSHPPTRALERALCRLRDTLRRTGADDTATSSTTGCSGSAHGSEPWTPAIRRADRARLPADCGFAHTASAGNSIPMLMSVVSVLGLAALGGGIAAGLSLVIAVAVVALVVAALANAVAMLRQLLGVLRP